LLLVRSGLVVPPLAMGPIGMPLRLGAVHQPCGAKSPSSGRGGHPCHCWAEPRPVLAHARSGWRLGFFSPKRGGRLSFRAPCGSLLALCAGFENLFNEAKSAYLKDTLAKIVETDGALGATCASTDGFGHHGRCGRIAR
jgi:hypothetical protein